METRLTEVADGVHQLTTHISEMDFSFNQYFVNGEEPLLFHTGGRGLFPLVSEAVGRVTPIDSLRWITFGHVEADECGSMNDWLGVAPQATVAQGVIGCMVSLNDLADRPPRPLADGEVLDIGGHRIRWIDMPHVPHAWENGIVYDETTRTLFCGDLFTQGGSDLPPITASDILESSEAFRHGMDYFSHTKNAHVMLERLAATAPTTLACMHGSAWRGDGAKLLRALADALSA